MTKKILVIGANGMLGGSIFRYLSSNTQFEVLGSVRSESAKSMLSSQGFKNTIVEDELSDYIVVSKLLDDTKPDIVINCVGLIKQLEQSKAPIPAIQINSLLPHQLAESCDRIGAKLIHFSTDCVFSGSKGMYSESDVPDANDLYGRSKLLGEVTYGKHLTFRTSIIGHQLDSTSSLISWFLAQSGIVNGFSKAVFSGLPTIYVAEFLKKHVLNNSDLSGLFHLSVDPIDKYSLLNLVGQQYGLSTNIIESRELRIDRSLDSSKLAKATEHVAPKWPQLIERMHNEYSKYFI